MTKRINRTHLYGYADYSVTSVKAKRPYNHITLKPKKLKLAKVYFFIFRRSWVSFAAQKFGPHMVQYSPSVCPASS